MRNLLLTGATDGIGLELARLWQARGEQPFLHGRRPLEELDRKVFQGDRYVRADLSEPEAPVRMASFLGERGVEALDVLVLNAAIGWVGEPGEQSAEGVRELLEVDVLAPLRLTHLLLPRLRRAGGRIVFVSSIAADLPAPRYATYAAAKAAVEGFFRSLRVELQGDGVEVQVIRPGAVRTSMHEKSGATQEDYDWRRFPPAGDVARRIARLVQGPPTWRTLGLGNALLRRAGKHLPRVVDRLQERRR